MCYTYKWYTGFYGIIFAKPLIQVTTKQKEKNFFGKKNVLFLDLGFCKILKNSLAPLLLKMGIV